MSTAEKIYVALVENPGEQGILAERYRIRAWTADPERAKNFRDIEKINTVEYVRADTAVASIADSLKRIADALTYQSAGGENLYDMIRSISQGGKWQ